MTHQRPKTDGVAVRGTGTAAELLLSDYPIHPALGGLPAPKDYGITDLTDAATKSMTDPSMEELARQIQTHLNAEQIYLGNAKAESARAQELKARLDEKFEAESKRVDGND